MPRTRMSGDDAIDESVMHVEHKGRQGTETGGLDGCAPDDDQVLRWSN